MSVLEKFPKIKHLRDTAQTFMQNVGRTALPNHQKSSRASPHALLKLYALPSLGLTGIVSAKICMVWRTFFVHSL
eukprot:2756416-Amphidinium_carterae.3